MASQSQSQSQEEEREKTTMKKSAFAEIDGGEFGTPSPSPNPNSSSSTTTTTTDSDTSTVDNSSLTMGIEFMEEVRGFKRKRMRSLAGSSSSSSSNSSAVLQARPPLPPARRLKLSPTLASAAAAAATTTTVAYTELDLGRISKLEKMVRVLKRMHSSLRRDYWTSPPTCDEIRMYHLILIHVNSYISLFHIERSSSPSHRTLPLFPKPKQGEGEGEEEKEEELAEALDDKAGVLYIYPGLLASTLEEGRNAYLKPELDPLFRNLPLMKAMVEDNTRNPESKQKLMRILSDLEEMGRARGYAPPLKGHEIDCYREIRNQTIFSIVFVYSNVDLHVGTKTIPRCRPPKVPHPPYDCLIHAPLGHSLAAGYDMIPVHQSFFDICRHHLSTIEDGDGPDDDDDVEGEVAISNTGVEVKDDGGEGGGRRPVMKSRLECLQIIVSEFIRIVSMRSSPNLPTKEEVRLYAQIAEHVYSSIWLFDASEDIQTQATGTGRHELIDVTDAFYNSPGSNNNENIREQYLRVIVSYLDAVKSSCLATIPSVEEMGYYKALSKGLDHSFMSSSISADHCVETRQTTREEMRASLKSQLVSIYKMQLNFCEEVMRESNSIAQLLQLSADGREMDYFSDDDVVVKKVKEFLGEQICETKLKQLNRLIVILIEICHFESGLGRLLEGATWGARERYSLNKDYEAVAREFHVARCANPEIN